MISIFRNIQCIRKLKGNALPLRNLWSMQTKNLEMSRWNNYNYWQEIDNCNVSGSSGYVQHINEMRDVTSFEQPIIFNCGELGSNDAGKIVRLTGRFGKKESGKFAELKDRHGITQIVIENKHKNVSRRLSKMPHNCTLTVMGIVHERPIKSINHSLPTGKIEVEVFEVLDFEFNHRLRSKNKRSYSTMTKTQNTGITTVEYKMSKSENILKYFENREFTCNDLDATCIGKTVTLIGWLPTVANVKFQQLKDGYGSTQIVLDDDTWSNIVDSIPSHAIIQIKGTVFPRPQKNINTSCPTGDIEVKVNYVKVLNPEEPYIGPVKKNINEIPIVNVKNDHETCADLSVNNIVANSNKFTLRTHNCGELKLSHVGEKVILCGWLEYQRMDKFLVLRDGYGNVQILVPNDLVKLSEIPFESILKIEGTVIPRPSDMINLAMATGEIEVEAKTVTVLNLAKRNLPIEVRDFNRAQETLRMEHRYIDLRFPDMQKNLRMRSKVLMKMREYLINCLGFVEVETPTLFRRTPGGAQEFIVPSRKPGHFYALTQSPQQFKQMLMAGAVDRYFQIARCYRDESTRPDRQPEFTQLDIELSFTNRESIIRLIEETLYHCWPEELSKIKIPFRKMSYDEAMKLYGTDKPDISFDLTFIDVAEILNKNLNLSHNCEKFAAYAIVVTSSNLSNNNKKQLSKISKDFPKCKFVLSEVKDLNTWANSLEKLLSYDVAKNLLTDLQLKQSDIVLLAYGPKRQTETMLGRIRVAFHKITNDSNPSNNIPQYHFLWVTDFPLFEENEITGDIESVHHPFTAPIEKYKENLLNEDKLLDIRSEAYDLVLNGEEIGGGSIRIHDMELQKFVLEKILKISYNHLEHLLNALESGCPPHGGIALGIDRLLSIMCNTNSIRDVIAFPKGADGKDHLSKAPVPISNAEKLLYNIEVVNNEK